MRGCCFTVECRVVIIFTVVVWQESSLSLIIIIIIITKSRSCWSQHWSNWVPTVRVYYYGHGCVLLRATAQIYCFPTPVRPRSLFHRRRCHSLPAVPVTTTTTTRRYFILCVLYTKLFSSPFFLFLFFVILYIIICSGYRVVLLYALCTCKMYVCILRTCYNGSRRLGTNRQNERIRRDK